MNYLRERNMDSIPYEPVLTRTEVMMLSPSYLTILHLKN
jgi:hypothetical protein